MSSIHEKDTKLLDIAVSLDKVAQKPKKTHRKGLQRRNYIEIRKRILESLSEYAKSSTEVATELGADKRTIANHIEYLSELGVIRLADFRIKDKARKLWIKVAR